MRCQQGCWTSCLRASLLLSLVRRTVRSRLPCRPAALLLHPAAVSLIRALAEGLRAAGAAVADKNVRAQHVQCVSATQACWAAEALLQLLGRSLDQMDAEWASGPGASSSEPSAAAPSLAWCAPGSMSAAWDVAGMYAECLRSRALFSYAMRDWPAGPKVAVGLLHAQVACTLMRCLWHGGWAMPGRAALSLCTSVRVPS